MVTEALRLMLFCNSRCIDARCGTNARHSTCASRGVVSPLQLVTVSSTWIFDAGGGLRKWETAPVWV
ncbi:Hypothetical predicted protein, partial [Olea europaea subsp. europaea]